MSNETTCPHCSISPVMCKCCGEVLSDLPPSQVSGKTPHDIEQWYHNWMESKGKSGEVATINEIDMLKDFAASQPRPATQVEGVYVLVEIPVSERLPNDNN